jgi:hypothetical protein
MQFSGLMILLESLKTIKTVLQQYRLQLEQEMNSLTIHSLQNKNAILIEQKIMMINDFVTILEKHYLLDVVKTVCHTGQDIVLSDINARLEQAKLEAMRIVSFADHELLALQRQGQSAHAQLQQLFKPSIISNERIDNISANVLNEIDSVQGLTIDNKFIK